MEAAIEGVTVATQEKTRLFDLWWSVLTFKCNDKKMKVVQSDYHQG